MQCAAVCEAVVVVAPRSAEKLCQHAKSTSTSPKHAFAKVQSPQKEPRSSKIQPPVETPPCVPWLPAMFSFAFWVPSVHPHTKARTTRLGKPSKHALILSASQGSSWETLSFSFFFFFFLSIPFFSLFATPFLTWRVKSMASSFLGQLCQIIWCELMSTRA